MRVSSLWSATFAPTPTSCSGTPLRVALGWPRAKLEQEVVHEVLAEGLAVVVPEEPVGRVALRVVLVVRAVAVEDPRLGLRGGVAPLGEGLEEVRDVEGEVLLERRVELLANDGLVLVSEEARGEKNN